MSVTSMIIFEKNCTFDEFSVITVDKRSESNARSKDVSFSLRDKKPLIFSVYL